jgi:tetratricopeptide (TPR) repeat protein
MQDEDRIKEGRDQGNLGIQAIGDGRRDDGAVHFGAALDAFEAITEPETRRDELSTFAMLCDETGFPDLGLLAAQDAVLIGRDLRLRRPLAVDLLTLGNTQRSLGNTDEAEASYREALSLFIEAKSWADAASASTNIALIRANDDDTAAALPLLENSLEYLEEEAFPDTEFITRAALLQVHHDDPQDDPAPAIENARLLCDRFWPTMSREHRGYAEGLLGPVIDRYLAAHPLLDSSSWKAANFPAVYG